MTQVLVGAGARSTDETGVYRNREARSHERDHEPRPGGKAAVAVSGTRRTSAGGSEGFEEGIDRPQGGRDGQAGAALGPHPVLVSQQGAGRKGRSYRPLFRHVREAGTARPPRPPPRLRDGPACRETTPGARNFCRAAVRRGSPKTVSTMPVRSAASPPPMKRPLARMTPPVSRVSPPPPGTGGLRRSSSALRTGSP